MSILDDLLASLPDDDAPVRNVLVGVHWTVVCGRHCGMASTITGEKPHGHEQVQDVGRLHLRSARKLAEYARSDNLLEASIGVAAISVPPRNFLPASLLEGAQRCLYASRASGGGVVKSIEIY